MKTQTSLSRKEIFEENKCGGKDAIIPYDKVPKTIDDDLVTCQERQLNSIYIGPAKEQCCNGRTSKAGNAMCPT